MKKQEKNPKQILKTKQTEKPSQKPPKKPHDLGLPFSTSGFGYFVY